MIPNANIITPSELQILAALEGGVRTWMDIKKSTRLDDDRLGLALARLFAQRKVRTGFRGNERVYRIINTAR
ncbi:MAG TPA: hypothetical protein VM870_03905 [Pyrinomonadaceae bacterium]|jgi:hypothetical protein|nr:hypothetical protein [Pyrinomonadaceae bacterium]